MESAVVNYQISHSQKHSEQQIRPRDNSARADTSRQENGFKQQVRILNNLSEKLDEYFSVPHDPVHGLNQR
jgi:Asp-tRNA(Asn)/Glu-tRNA(Gln) amidotransferase C subunit